MTLCEPLAVEDQVVQSMPDASPTKWHLAHTTWFFETLVVKPHLTSYRTPDERYAYLFNSYYNALGEQFLRAERGLLSGTVKLTKTGSLDPQDIGGRRICERGILCRGFDALR